MNSNPVRDDWDSAAHEEKEAVRRQLRIKLNEAKEMTAIIQNSDNGWLRLEKAFEAALKRLE